MSSYNERLFNKGLRKHMHLSRFNWLKKKCEEYNACCDNVVELGCFDGRSIDYLPVRPSRYYGFDAGQGGGIIDAIEKYKDYTFFVSSSPDDLKKLSNSSLVISLETLEHIKPEILGDYFSVIHDIMAEDAYFIITVPNEMGIIFLLKYLSKKLYYGITSDYSFKEIIAATTSQMRFVTRNNHKGFDWQDMTKQLQKQFKVINVEGVQVAWLPPSLNVTIGIICSK